MLTIHVPSAKFWDEEKEVFIRTKDTTLKMEHSLISISKWEAKWHIPFYETEKTAEQVMSYLQCMTLNQDVDPLVYGALTVEQVNEINAYISDSMTATKIYSEDDKPGTNNQKITSELIYYWMIKFGIPESFEKWHLNRLLMLIRVISEEEKPKKKLSQRELMARHKAINAKRRAERKSRG